LQLIQQRTKNGLHNALIKLWIGKTPGAGLYIQLQNEASNVGNKLLNIENKHVMIVNQFAVINDKRPVYRLINEVSGYRKLR
jgi:hypothetical protein